MRRAQNCTGSSFICPHCQQPLTSTALAGGVAHTAAEQEISPCEAAGQVRDSASAERSPRTSEITASVFNEEMGIAEASGLMRQDSSLTQSQAGLSLPRQMLLIHRALLLPMETEDEMSANLIKHK